MESLQELKSAVAEFITPIIESAVKRAMPVIEQPAGKEYLTLTEVEEQYNISQTTIYRRFYSGELTKIKIKNGDRTMVRRSELEANLREGKLAAVGTRSRRNKGGK